MGFQFGDIWLSGMLWFCSICFFIFGLLVFSIILPYLYLLFISWFRICCIFHFFSYLILFHSDFFLGLSVYYVYIYYINYIYIHKTHYICCLYSGLFSLILRLTAMINYVLCSCVLCYILCCFLVFLCAFFFICAYFSYFVVWICITTSRWVSSFFHGCSCFFFCTF